MDGESTIISNELVEAARGGDQAAARQLIESLYPTVISIVRNHLPWSEQEEDLAQDIFLKFFSKLRLFRGDKPILHWVRRIAVFTCYDALRRQRRRNIVYLADLGEDHSAILETALRADGRAESEHNPGQVRELLDKLLGTLKPDQQLVVRLMDIERRSVKEIEALTGWKESKIKVTALRARRKLGEALARLEARTIPRP